MTSIGTGDLNAEPVARLVRNGRIVNRILASICAQENLSKIGVKAELQNRIINKLHQYAANNDIPKFDRLKAMIENPAIIPQHGYYSHVATMDSPTIIKDSKNTAMTPSAVLSHGNFHSSISNDIARGNRYRNFGAQAIQLKPSPFYSIVEQLGPTLIFEVMATHRYTARTTISVNQHPILNRLPQESDLRVMVFGVSEGQAPQDIAFPYQSELKVNGEEIKANLRGLKKKSGTTRPVDITDKIRLHPASYLNNIEMTYALTNKRFYLMVYVTKIVTVQDLVQKLVDGKKLITEKSTIAEMVNKARDTDIIATASVLSLKCPLSTTRIDLPCRSFACRHTQCFDATSYLQLQEQGPTWSCPICNNSAPFESLAIDEYVQNILRKTARPVEQVTIQLDGKWELNDRRETPLNLKAAANDSDDEVIEITSTGSNSQSFTMKNSEGFPRKPQSLTNGSFKKPDSIQSSASISSMKRPLAIVIDLTSSGDEDEESPSVRPGKRQCVINGYCTSSDVP